MIQTILRGLPRRRLAGLALLALAGVSAPLCALRAEEPGLAFSAIRDTIRGDRPLAGDNRLRSGEVVPDPRPRVLFSMLDRGPALPAVVAECGTSFFVVL